MLTKMDGHEHTPSRSFYIVKICDGEYTMNIILDKFLSYLNQTAVHTVCEWSRMDTEYWVVWPVVELFSDSSCHHGYIGYWSVHLEYVRSGVHLHTIPKAWKIVLFASSPNQANAHHYGEITFRLDFKPKPGVSKHYYGHINAPACSMEKEEVHLQDMIQTPCLIDKHWGYTYIG